MSFSRAVSRAAYSRILKNTLIRNIKVGDLQADAANYMFNSLSYFVSMIFVFLISVFNAGGVGFLELYSDWLVDSCENFLF